MSDQPQNGRPSFYKKRYLDRIDSFLHDLLNDLSKDDPAGLKRLLDFYSTKFQRWSPSNIVGIFLQKPKCERPVTVSEAKKLGHTVKPGVPRATILVPVFKPEDPEEVSQQRESADNRVDGETEPAATEAKQLIPPASDSIEPKLKLVGFRAVPCVVDLGKETQGPPILSSTNQSLNQDTDLLLEALRKFAAEINITVDDRLNRRVVRSGGTGAAAQLRDGSVHISTLGAMPPVRRFHSLVHELTHGMLHFQDENAEAPETKDAELQAAGVSYFVGKHFRLEENFEALYLKNWGVTGKDVLRNLAVIVKASREIVEGISRQLAPRQEEVLVEDRPIEQVLTPGGLDRLDDYEIDEVIEIVDDTEEHFSQVVYVYHAKDPQTAEGTEFDAENYTLVARCERSNLADAFGKTQNFEGRWAAGDNVDITVYGAKSQRSSSVGDVFLVEGEGYYKVNQDGWVKIEELNENDATRTETVARA